MTKEQDPTLLAIGEKIRIARESAGFSQEGFAHQMGIARTYYGRVERGEQNLTLFKLVDIAIALNVEISELLPSLRKLKKCRGDNK